MKRKQTLLSILTIPVVLIVLLVTFTSCGAKDLAMDDAGFTDPYYNYTGSVSEEVMFDEEAPESSGGAVNTMSSAEKAPDKPNAAVGDHRKIIVRSELSVQTKEFDALMDAVYSKINELGGYVESANVNGNALNSYSMRNATIVIRIPSDADAAFTDFIDQNSVVIRRSVQTEDVTLSYVDLESRLSALRAEKKALEGLLENAAQMEDIIAVTDKLTEVIQEIESYESRLRVYDNLIEYCTVSLFIDEVEYTTPVEKQSAWTTIGENLKQNFADMWRDVVSVFVSLVSGLPYWIPVLVIGVPAFLLVRRTFRKRRANKKSKTVPEKDNDTNA